MVLTTRDPSARDAKGANVVMACPRYETESMRGGGVHARMAENAIHIPIAQAPGPAVGKPRFPSMSLRSHLEWAYSTSRNMPSSQVRIGTICVINFLKLNVNVSKQNI
jgi:hypothetical protein